MTTLDIRVLSTRHQAMVYDVSTHTRV